MDSDLEGYGDEHNMAGCFQGMATGEGNLVGIKIKPRRNGSKKGGT